MQGREPGSKLTLTAVLAAMGPGLLAALAGNDAGGIATYSSAGASFGYGTLWILPVMALLLIVVQETAARCGCVTGKGFASLIREKFGVRLSALAMGALLIANTAVTISEFAGIASGLALFGVPTTISVPLTALAIWLITMSGSFARIEKILLLVSCVFLTYVVAAFMVGPDWASVARATVTPQVMGDPDYVSLLVATIGTTIAPWMIFLAQNNVVDKNVREDGIVLQRVDTVSGSVIACAIAWFIIVTTATVLHPAGIEVGDAADAALAHRRPVVDDSLWRRSCGREFPGCLRSAGRDVKRDLRGIWMGARRRSHVGRGSDVSRNHHGHHHAFGAAGNPSRG